MNWREKIREIIFEAETPAGKIFDIGLIICILLSILLVMLESVKSVRNEYGSAIIYAEWTFTIIFSIEYIFRIITVGRPFKYATSFFGVIDLISIMPTYLNYFFPGTHYLIVFRFLRVLRIFRVLKLVQFVGEAEILKRALVSSRRKITVFFAAVLVLVTILGSIMYLIEGEENGFTSIPRGIYWAIVTLTTVGYGDIAPKTSLGQGLASFVMILGYAIIAVPTGIVSAELTHNYRTVSTRACPECSEEGHDSDATHCKYCGADINEDVT